MTMASTIGNKMSKLIAKKHIYHIFSSILFYTQLEKIKNKHTIEYPSTTRKMYKGKINQTCKVNK